MVYYDIHTHHLPVHPEDVAIVNSLVPTFDVETGLFRSVGIHPWYIYNVEEQLAELKRQVSFPDVVAIGETGLDKGAEAPLDCQREIFRASASLAENAGVFFNRSLRESLGRTDSLEKRTKALCTVDYTRFSW